MAVEEHLSGGHLSGAVRIGATVRRPTGPWTPAVHELLRHLERVGFTGTPRVLGFDDLGREILEYIPGTVPWLADHHDLLGDDGPLARAGRLLREFHDAVASFDVPAGTVWRFPEMEADSEAWVDERGKIICHNDATAWNIVVGDRWAFIDWDTAGPRPFIWDVAYAAIGLLPITPDASGLGWSDVPVPHRLQVFADGYGLSSVDRLRLIDAIIARISSSYEHMKRRADAGIEPWVRMWTEGHGKGWAGMLLFAKEHREEWTRESIP